MPKSKHGKKHKKKVAEYKRQIQVTNKRLKEQKIKDYFEKVKEFQLKNQQQISNVVENENTNVDVDVDLDIDVDVDLNVDINTEDISK
ncbi:hypothetical protein [Trichloromonas sp.]|uniref:hypothetical protein n=1 Tax=Trichloromonas sp. TaxID=3069249 RepID=UPI002A4B92CA|nr:hypothetical protein [Trichloromonas sp.]